MQLQAIIAGKNGPSRTALALLNAEQMNNRQSSVAELTLDHLQ